MVMLIIMTMEPSIKITQDKSIFDTEQFHCKTESNQPTRILHSNHNNNTILQYLFYCYENRITIETQFLENLAPSSRGANFPPAKSI